ncbi:hypothetical protein DLAC_11209 [Tieghemostelium lacteum]|uniref:Uncharacterized protein n=1 Tax=Tieghemostelium lacteum TaxID=361077 RepID=A0A151Z3H7_TIELA|nr:hypothetical protein DLAC_11209 [Tieghemostelium lacteum]|eukprot:KYQ88495.1 hypothetical protein DLAC_11209 [Tieghemostelium lacteum]
MNNNSNTVDQSHQIQNDINHLKIQNKIMEIEDWIDLIEKHIAKNNLVNQLNLKNSIDNSNEPYRDMFKMPWQMKSNETNSKCKFSIIFDKFL